ncbi:MAG: hypothetical protein AB1644_04850 [Candidatus Zixiibacteriota bacterium]
MRTITVLLLATLLLCVAGCNSDQPAPVATQNDNSNTVRLPAEIQSQLDKLTPTEADLESDFTSLPSVQVPPPVFDTSFDVYAVGILWGHLANRPLNGTTTTDWSGSLWVNGVAVVTIPLTLGFEPNQDSLLPQTIPSQAAWVSYTTGDFDGIAALVFLKRGIVYITPPVLTFETPPFTKQFTFEQLRRLNVVYQVDSVNSVAIQARKLWPFPCPQGIMRGEWVKNNISGDSGHFGGLWLEQTNTPAGVYSGVFWTTSDGRRLFEGWVSGYMTDQIIAYLRGTWYYDDPTMCPLCGSGHGRYSGYFKYVNSTRGGTIDGEVGWAPSIEQLNLPMVGVWKQFCPFGHDDDHMSTQ